MSHTTSFNLHYYFIRRAVAGVAMSSVALILSIGVLIDLITAGLLFQEYLRQFGGLGLG